MKPEFLSYYSALLATVVPNHFVGKPESDANLIAMSLSLKPSFGVSQDDLDQLRKENHDSSEDLDLMEQLARAVFADLHAIEGASYLIEAVRAASGTSDDAFVATVSTKEGLDGIKYVVLAVSDANRLADILGKDLFGLQAGGNFHD